MRVQVCSFHGGVLDLDLRPQDTGTVVKEAISLAWHIPALCQELLAGDDILSDSAQLASVCPHDAATFSLTVVVTMKNVMQFLEVPGNKTSGLEHLKKFGSNYRHAIVPVVSPLLSDSVKGVRRAAAETLAQVAGKGDQEVIAAVCALLEHKLDDVREHVTSLLNITTEPNDPFVIDTISKSMCCGSCPTRMSALHTLAGYARKAEVSAVVKQVVKDEPSLEIKTEALSVLRQVAAKGDHDIVPLATDCLQSGHEPLHDNALAALGDLAENGCQDAIAAIAWCLELDVGGKVANLFDMMVSKDTSLDVELAIVEVARRLAHKNPVVRRCALQAYSCLSKKVQVVLAVKSCLEEDGYVENKIEALSILHRVVAKDDGQLRLEEAWQAVSLASNCLEQEDTTLYPMAIKVMDKLAQKGDENAIAALITGMEHRSPIVRARAVTALGTCGENAVAAMRVLQAEPCTDVKMALLRVLHTSKAARSANVNREAVGITRTFLKEENWHVRLLALQALGVLLPREDLLGTCMDALQDDSPAVRESALQMLSQTAVHGDQSVVSRAISSAVDSDARVRTAAMLVLRRIAKKDDRQALAAARVGINDDVAIVRNAAEDALGSFTPACSIA